MDVDIMGFDVAGPARAGNARIAASRSQAGDGQGGPCCLHPLKPRMNTGAHPRSSLAFRLLKLTLDLTMYELSDMKTSVILSTAEVASLRRLGQSIRLARLRRNLSQEDLAGRMGVTRLSVIALEKGKAGASIGNLLKALTVMGYTERLGEILAADPIGDDLDLVTGRRRATARAHVADF
ncbi:MAG: helix-turn-helix transcriptional regulator [Microvirga sp.]